MEIYKNFGGDSNVLGFEIGNEHITVWFIGGKRSYTYSYSGKAGRIHVDKMKSLALGGSGLNGYINSNVKYLYD